jgi:hypothetical protein
MWEYRNKRQELASSGPTWRVSHVRVHAVEVEEFEVLGDGRRGRERAVVQRPVVVGAVPLLPDVHERARGPHLGFGRIAASEKEAPNMWVILV